MKKVILKNNLAFEEELKGYVLVTYSVSFNNKIVMLLNSISTNYNIPLEEDTFPLLPKDKKKNYKVVIKDEKTTKIVYLNNQIWDYDLIEVLSDDEIILASSRANLYHDLSFDKNAKVFDFNGNLLREFLLGDGIKGLQVSNEKKIVCCYYDEGIWGNYGWGSDGFGKRPIGSSGLVFFDKFGNVKYEYDTKNKSLDYIHDTYSMTLTDENNIFIHYDTTSSNHGLMHLKNKEVVKKYPCYPNEKYSEVLSIIDNKYLLKIEEDFSLFELGDKEVQKLENYNFYNDEGKVLNSKLAYFRGNTLYIENNNRVYYIDIREIIKSK